MILFESVGTIVRNGSQIKLVRFFENFDYTYLEPVLGVELLSRLEPGEGRFFPGGLSRARVGGIPTLEQGEDVLGI